MSPLHVRHATCACQWQSAVACAIAPSSETSAEAIKIIWKNTLDYLTADLHCMHLLTEFCDNTHRLKILFIGDVKCNQCSFHYNFCFDSRMTGNVVCIVIHSFVTFLCYTAILSNAWCQIAASLYTESVVSYSFLTRSVIWPSSTERVNTACMHGLFCRKNCVQNKLTVAVQL